ncbi:hypothetical protein NQ315_003810 [Exocentrus adspersus]|uniref:Uncharacterized protein n=1 Tax=Exocentrus adspersus TaxID=1586481 RepID=A0AAV8VEE3_9CUCU|nr:hypothetical protein NQ315_003810 [Exocentrus adspersus]
MIESEKNNSRMKPIGKKMKIKNQKLGLVVLPEIEINCFLPLKTHPLPLPDLRSPGDSFSSNPNYPISPYLIISNFNVINKRRYHAT